MFPILILFLGNLPNYKPEILRVSIFSKLDFDKILVLRKFGKSTNNLKYLKILKIKQKGIFSLDSFQNK